MSKIKEIYLHNYKKPAYGIETIYLVFDLFEEYALVSSTMQIQKSDVNEQHLRLDSIDLELVSLYINDLELDESRYIIENESLTVLNVPSSFTIKIENKIYPQNNTELEGLYKSGDIFCTQNEPEGFRRITPYLDRPDVMSVDRKSVV